MRTARILLAEDDEIMRVTLCDRLIKNGWQVDEAEDGKEALEKIQSNHYHLIISDIRMPHLNGIQLLDEVKQLARNSLKHSFLPASERRELLQAWEAKISTFEQTWQPKSSTEGCRIPEVN